MGWGRGFDCRASIRTGLGRDPYSSPRFHVVGAAAQGAPVGCRSRGGPRYHVCLLSPAAARDLADRFNLAELPVTFYADPYPTYRALREHAPVKQMPDGSWFLTRFEDIVPVYRDPKLFSSDK